MNNIQKIAHLSDIHIRTLDRHDEYRTIFKTLYSRLKEDAPDLITITGDVFHAKAFLTPELLNVASELLEGLAAISQVAIIPGNHDGILSNKDRLTAVSALVKLTKINNVTLLPNGLTKYGNVHLYHYSVFSND